MQLVITDDEGKTTIVPLEDGEVTVGRAEQNKVRLTERNVSRKHARFVRSKGTIWLEDLQSYNGIRVNGSRIVGRCAVRLRDQIELGDYRITLTQEGLQGTEDASTGSFKPVADAPTAMITLPGEATVRTSIAPAPAARARLVSLSLDPGHVLALEGDELTLGSDPSCAMVLRHRSVSGEHAKVLRVNQVFRILDLDSTNGVRVNGREVRYAELDHGDTIELGEIALRYELEGHRPRTRAPVRVARARPAGSRAVALGLGAIVIVAAGVALALAFSPSEEPHGGPAPGARAAAPLLPPPPARQGPGTNPREALEQAQALRASGDFDGALRRASEAKTALEQTGQSTQAVEPFITELVLELRGQQQLAQVRDLLEGNAGAEAVFEAATRIPHGTAAYDDPGVADNALEVFRARVAQAKADLQTGAAPSELRPRIEEILGEPRVHDATDQAGLVALRDDATALLREISEGEQGTVRTGQPRAPHRRPEGREEAPPPAPTGPGPGEAQAAQAVMTAARSDPARAKSMACAFVRRFPSSNRVGMMQQLCRR